MMAIRKQSLRKQPKQLTKDSQTSKAKRVRPRNTRAKRNQIPRTETQYQAKPEKFKQTWDRVISAISTMRRDRVSLAQASRDNKISPRTVTRWGRTALRKGKNGKYAAKPNDNLLRLVLIPTSQGTREIAVRGSKQVSHLAEYWNALDRYIQTGDTSQLEKFRGKSIKDANGVDVPFLTDLEDLNRLGSAGVLSFESLYARTA
jgi:hypothetical protein